MDNIEMKKIGVWYNGLEIYAKFTKQEDIIYYEGRKDNQKIFDKTISFSELYMFHKMYEAMLPDLFKKVDIKCLREFKGEV